jgi:hypothetical protein
VLSTIDAAKIAMINAGASKSFTTFSLKPVGVGKSRRIEQAERDAMAFINEKYRRKHGLLKSMIYGKPG